MRKLLMAVFAMFLMSGVSAQDAAAKAILDKASNKIKTLKGITANFSYVTKNKNNVKKGSVNGTISIKNQKYFIKQGSTEIISNGVKVWNYGGDKEVTVSTIDNDAQTLTPQKLLTNFYDKDFTYKLVRTAGAYNEIEMTPVDKRKNFKQVNIFISKANNLVSKARIIDKADNIIEFELKNINTAANLSDNLFVFDISKHPGVELIEQ